MYRKNIKTKKTTWKSSPITLGIIVVLLVGSLAFGSYWVFLRDDQPVRPATTANNDTKGEVSNDKPVPPPAGQPASSVSDDKEPVQGGAIPPAAELREPSGSFVSNHRPNLDGSPAPNTIQSICNTTPGATCQITFTKDGTTKSLTAQTTDKGGATYWTWKLQDIGLTEGSWQVKAIATAGNQTKTAVDSIALEVGL